MRKIIFSSSVKVVSQNYGASKYFNSAHPVPNYSLFETDLLMLKKIKQHPLKTNMIFQV